MYYKVFFTVLILITLISTLCVSIIKPDMHKRVFVYNSNYMVEPEETVTEEIIEMPTIAIEPEQQKIETEKIKPVETVEKVSTPLQPTQQVKIVTTPSQPAQQVKVVTTPIQKEQKIVKQESPKKTEQTKTVQKYELPPSVKAIVNNTTQTKPVKTQSTQTTKQEPVKTQTTQTQAPKPIVNTTPVQTPKKQQTNIVTTQTPQKTVIATTNPQPSKTVKILSAAEEEIAWNKWRSDLQNKLMNDVVLPAVPKGTVFKFSFDVDKYGKVSNIQTWSTTPQYTPYAIEHIAPVIRSYQGRAILNFPAGSQRVHTTASGAWRISNVSVYSSPSDYNDYEKVKK